MNKGLNWTIILVLLAASVVLFSPQISSIVSSITEDEFQREFVEKIEGLRKRDPYIEASTVISKGDYRFLGFSTGFGFALPGISCNAAMSSSDRNFREFLYKGDVTWGGAFNQFWDTYANFSSNYNRHVVWAASYPYKHICIASDGRKNPVAMPGPENIEQYNASLVKTILANPGLAAFHGQVDTLKSQKESGKNLDTVDMWLYTPLFHAVMGQQSAAVSYLLEQGADPNRVDRSGFSALIHASRIGNLGIAMQLVVGGAEVNILDSSTNTNWTALTFASRNGHADIVTYLIDKGARFGNLANRNATTPLTEAVRHNKIETVSILLDKGADPNTTTSSGQSALSIAFGTGNYEIATMLLRANARLPDMPDEVATLLFRASDNNKQRVLSYLLECKTLNIPVTNLIIDRYRHAIRNNDPKEVEQICVQNTELLREAESLVSEDNAKILDDFLLRHNPITQISLNKLLYSSVRNNTLVAMRLLLKAGADPNAVHIANTVGAKTFSSLPPVLTKHTGPPLITAIDSGHTAAVEMLLQNGADPNLGNKGVGLPPLHHAVKKGDSKVIALLIEYGANVNLQDTTGRTPLMWSVIYYNIESAELLLTSGGNPAIKSNNGETAKDFIKSNDNIIGLFPGNAEGLIKKNDELKVLFQSIAQ